MSTDLDDVIRRDDELYDMKGARQEAVAANGGKPQSLTSRLDVLAGAAGREDAPLVDRQQADAPHDPETGEIKSAGEVQRQPGEEDEGTGGDAGTEDDPGADTGQSDESVTQTSSPGDSRRNALMQKLRGKAQQGRQKLKLALGNLVPVENEMLTTADRQYLTGVAEDAEKEMADASSGR